LGIFPLLIGGNCIAGIGVLISIVYFAGGGTHAIGFFGPLLLVGAGNGLTLPTANAGIVSVRPHLAGSAAGLGGAIQIGGGAALSVLGGVLLSPTSGAMPLLLIMLASCILGIVMALYTRAVARKVAQSENTI
jgi:DHA1 family bicyclomycin/chloramphenicol resistance-like MFS transporter